VVYRGWYGYTDEGTTTTNGTAINLTIETRKEDLGQPLVKKVGGEVEARCLAAGDYDVSVYAAFDDGGYNYLGVVNLTGNLITFPVTFPVNFLPTNVIAEKFHLDGYSPWRYVQLKFVQNTTTSDDDIRILDYTITSFPEDYTNEE
jgi:hypothetical protein